MAHPSRRVLALALGAVLAHTLALTGAGPVGAAPLGPGAPGGGTVQPGVPPVPATPAATEGPSLARPLQQGVPTVGSADGQPATVLFAAPDTSSGAEVTLTPQRVERYAYWAQGTLLQATGLTPGAAATITATSPSGRVMTFDPATVDAEGRLERRLHALSNDTEVGEHRVLLRDAAGRETSALLDVFSNPRNSLRVSTSRPSVTQDDFLDEPVVIRVEGLQPRERLYVNIFSPDGAGQALPGNHIADASGVFTHTLQARTVSTPVGSWTASAISFSDQRGVSSFTVTPGAERVQRGTITLPSRPTQTQFRSGIPVRMTGLKPFSAFEVQLIGPRGEVSNLGAGRADGAGRHTNTLRGGSQSLLGVHELRIVAQTTGSWASARATVTDDAGQLPPPATVTTPTPRTTPSALADPAGGLEVRATGLAPSSFYSATLRTSTGALVPVRPGPAMTLALRTGTDGGGTATVSSRALVEPGRYQVWVSGPQTRMVLPVEVVAEAP